MFFFFFQQKEKIGDSHHKKQKQKITKKNQNKKKNFNSQKTSYTEKKSMGQNKKNQDNFRIKIFFNFRSYFCSTKFHSKKVFSKINKSKKHAPFSKKFSRNIIIINIGDKNFYFCKNVSEIFNSQFQFLYFFFLLLPTSSRAKEKSNLDPRSDSTNNLDVLVKILSLAQRQQLTQLRKMWIKATGAVAFESRIVAVLDVQHDKSQKRQILQRLCFAVFMAQIVEVSVLREIQSLRSRAKRRNRKIHFWIEFYATATTNSTRM